MACGLHGGDGGRHQVTLKNVKILLVEDHRDTREVYAAMLRTQGAVVYEAATAQVAMFVLQTHHPDLLLVDLGLPDASGYELLEAIRRLPDEDGGQTPAIALTALHTSYDRARSLMSGFKLHLSKPIEPERLGQIIGGMVVLGL